MENDNTEASIMDCFDQAMGNTLRDQQYYLQLISSISYDKLPFYLQKVHLVLQNPKIRQKFSLLCEGGDKQCISFLDQLCKSQFIKQHQAKDEFKSRSQYYVAKLKYLLYCGQCYNICVVQLLLTNTNQIPPECIFRTLSNQSKQWVYMIVRNSKTRVLQKLNPEHDYIPQMQHIDQEVNANAQTEQFQPCTQQEIPLEVYSQVNENILLNAVDGQYANQLGSSLKKSSSDVFLLRNLSLFVTCNANFPQILSSTLIFPSMYRKKIKAICYDRLTKVSAVHKNVLAEKQFQYSQQVSQWFYAFTDQSLYQKEVVSWVFNCKQARDIKKELFTQDAHAIVDSGDMYEQRKDIKVYSQTHVNDYGEKGVLFKYSVDSGDNTSAWSFEGLILGNKANFQSLNIRMVGSNHIRQTQNEEGRQDTFSKAQMGSQVQLSKYRYAIKRNPETSDESRFNKKRKSEHDQEYERAMRKRIIRSNERQSDSFRQERVYNNFNSIHENEPYNAQLRDWLQNNNNNMQHE